MPRPSKFSPKTVAEIAAYVAAGNGFDESCRAAGISPSTGYAWLEDAKDTNPNHRDRVRKLQFSDAIAHARESRKAKWVRAIAEAGEKDWRARAWLLARLYRDEFGDAVRVGGDPANRAPIPLQIDLSEQTALIASKLAGLSDDELRAMALRALAGSLVPPAGPAPDLPAGTPDA